MLAAGFWQLRRLDERRSENTAFVAQIELAPVPLEDIRDALQEDPAAYANRRVIVSGTYSPDQFVLFNRSQGGRAVDNVLTPLVITDQGAADAVLIVNRGAIGVGVPPPPPFPGDVEIVGRLRASESRGRGGLSDAEQQSLIEVRRVDLELLGRSVTAGTLLPMYVELLESTPAVGVDDPQLLESPELSEGNHLSYAFQWFIFSVCVAIGWVLAVRRSLRSRVSAAESDEPTRPDSLAPGGGASPTSTP